MNPGELACDRGNAHYFPDTLVGVRHVVTVTGSHRVLIQPLDNAFDAFATNERILTFDFSETAPNRIGIEFAHLFGRFPRVLDCYKSFMAMNWIPNDVHGGSFDGVRTSRGVAVFNFPRYGDEIFSPFKRVPWLETEPVLWTAYDVVRILLNGQHTACVEVVTSDGDDDDAVVSTRALEPSSLARYLVEETSLEYTVQAKAPGSKELTITCVPKAATRKLLNAPLKRTFLVVPQLTF